jgi:hypothetical protein
MFAIWEVNTYTVNLNVNRDDNDSTYATYYQYDTFATHSSNMSREKQQSGLFHAANAPSARRRSASVSYEVPGEEAASTEPAPKYKRTTPKNA